MHKLQEEYLFLVNHDIHSAEELVSVISSLTDKRKEVSAEKSRIYKARERSRELFDIADDMKELEPAEKSFLQGDEFFTDEHLQWRRTISRFCGALILELLVGLYAMGIFETEAFITWI